MATTSKYFIMPSAGENFLDFDLSYGSINLLGQQISFVGSASVDMVFLRPGVTLDFTLSGSGADKVYLTGNFADYNFSINFGVMTLTRGSGATLETLSFVRGVTTGTSDLLVFADGTVNTFDIFNHLNSGAATPIPTGETSVAPTGAAAGLELNASIKAFALDGSGEVFSASRPGIALTFVGSASVDTVYISDGSTVDATKLGGGVDLIYFRGNWADYSKSVDFSIVTFSRTVGSDTETVKIVGTSLLNDKLIFADGAVTSNDARLAISTNPSVSISAVANFDASTVTPGLDRDAPLLSSAEVNTDVLTLHYTEAGLLATSHVPATTDYLVTVTPSGGSAASVSVTAVTLLGNDVLLTLASPVANGSTVTVSYTGTALQDASGNLAVNLTNEPVSVPTGTLADGYIRDASIYVVIGGVEVDTGVKTNASGNFSLPDTFTYNSVDYDTSMLTIVAKGGVNIDTGVVNTLEYKAPAGATTVSPLTTLVQSYVDKQLALDPESTITASDAETAIQTALGLPSGVDLLTFDPLAADPTNPDALAVQKAAAQIATIATLAASAPASGSTSTDAANEVMANLVTAVNDGSVNLSDGGTASGLLLGAIDPENTAVSEAVFAAVIDIGSAGSLTAISTAQSVALDNTAPDAPIAAPDLVAGSDTGRLNNDDITTDTTPTVRVRLNITALDGTAAVVGDTVKLFDGANQVAMVTLTEFDIMNGYVDVTTSELTATSHSLTATLTDVAGNLSVASTALNLLIDTAAPLKTVSNMALSADTGSSATDRITKTAAQTITATLSATLAADERLYGSTDGGVTWKDINGSVSGTNISWKGVTLSAGENTLQIQVRDLAGNAGTSAIQTFTLDTTAPTALTLSISGNAATVGAPESNATWEYSLNSGTTWQSGTGTGFTLPIANYAANAIQVRQTDLAGNTSAVSSTSKNTTPITLDPPPVFQSAAVDGNTLVLMYDEALDATNLPAGGAFSVLVNSVARSVTGVAVSGSNVTLTLASAVAFGETVTVAYTDPTAGNDTNAIQDAGGNDAVSLSATAVTNNTPSGPDLTAPTLSSAVIVGNVLTLTYNEAIDAAHMPSASYFSVALNGSTYFGAVDTVSVDGSQVKLIMRTSVSNTDSVTVSYKDPNAVDDAIAVQDLAGNDVTALSNFVVTNNTLTNNGASPRLAAASFAETANASITLTFTETMSWANDGSIRAYLNGQGENILTTATVSGKTLTLTTAQTLSASDFVVVSHYGYYIPLSALDDNTPVSPGSILIGGSGANAIDLSNIDWYSGIYTWPITVRSNGGNDLIVGTAGSDTLIGGGGSDTLIGSWGADVINVSEPLTARATDVVKTVSGTDEFGSLSFAIDEVVGFDVSGTTTNDKLNLASKTIAANTSGDVTGSQMGNFAKHSITNGILTLKDSAGNAILVYDDGTVGRGNTYAANDYLLANLTNPGEAVGVYVDTDNDGQADSLAVYQYHGDEVDMNTLILLKGVTNVTLGNIQGQNVVQIVDTTGPSVNGVTLTDNLANDTLTLHLTEAASAVNFAGLTLQKGNGYTLGTASASVGTSVSGSNVTVTTGLNLTSSDYLMLKGNGTITDTAGNVSNLLDDVEAGAALGASGDTTIDLSAQAGFYAFLDLAGGNDTFIANNDGSWMEAGAGNDTLRGGNGDDELDGGKGADYLVGGDGIDEFDFLQGDSTTFAFSNGTFTFSGGVDIIADLKDAGDNVQIRSGNKVYAEMSWMTEFTGTVGEQQAALVQGTYTNDQFTASANGPDTLVVYDADPDTLSVNSGFVLLGVAPTQLRTQEWDNALYIERLADGDTTAPINTGASFSGNIVTLTFSENVVGNIAGISLSLNPSELNYWQGGPISITNYSIVGSTLTLTTDITFETTDVVKFSLDAGFSNLSDASGNKVFSSNGEVWIGGSGASNVDLSGYWSYLEGASVLRGNGGNDSLVGTSADDVFIDGGGADTLAGSWGADIIRLVENGGINGGATYSRDVIRFEPGHSFATYMGMDTSDVAMDTIAGSLTSPTGTGFDITSATVSNHDALDLNSNGIVANASHVDGVDVGGFAKHSITSGIVTLEDASGNALLVNGNNVQDAVAYLTTNFTTAGLTAAVKLDLDGNGVVDSLGVFQDHGTVPLMNNMPLPNTAILLQNLIGIENAVLGTTAGANVVQIIDTQAPEPVGYALTGNGLALNFAENAYATTSVALSILKNGTTAATISSVTGSGSTNLTVVTNQTFGATDWALINYTGTTTSNGVRDASNNVLGAGESDPSYGGEALGSEGNNTIDLSGLSGADYDLVGRGGNDVLIGTNDVNFGNWFMGGTGADTMIAGAGWNEFEFEQGDSPLVTGLNLANGSNATALDNGDTFTFANGVDLIDNFASGNAISLDVQFSELMSGVVGFMGGWISQPPYGTDLTPPSDGLATDQGYFVVRGDYVGSTFTVNNATGLNTLIVWDGDSSANVSQTGIVLEGVTPDALSLYPGSNWITSVL